jgi:hypothetical protein
MTGGFRLESDGGAQVVDALTGSGLIADGFAVTLVARPAHAALVRPVVEDGEAGWRGRLERALPAGGGRRVAIVSDDPLIAGAVAGELAAWLGDRGTEVTVVDGSVESPAVSKPMREDGDEGLVDVALFGVSPEAAMRRTLAPGVSVVTTGSYPMDVDAFYAGEPFGRLNPGPSGVLVAVLPSSRVAAAGGFDAVVVVGANAAEIGAAAAAAGDAGVGRVIGMVLRDTWRQPEPEPPPVEEVAEAPARADMAEREAVPTREERMPEETEAPAAGAAREETPAATEAAPPQSPFLRDTVVTAAARAPRRRVVRPGVASTWVVVAIVAAGALWYGLVRPRGRVVVPGRPGVEETRLLGEETAGVSGEAPPPSTAGAPGEAAPVAGEPETGGEAGGAVAAAETAAVAEAPERAPGSAVPGPGGPYVVYISSYRLESSAERDAAHISALGVPVEVVRAEVGESGTWFRVAVRGGYPTLSAARETLEAIKDLGYEDAWLAKVREGD